MKSGAHHNKGSHLGNTRSRHLETAIAQCRSIMLFILLLKREPALLNAHQVPIPICSCIAIKKPRISNVKTVRHVYPEEAKSSEARSVYACTLQHHSVGV